MEADVFAAGVLSSGRLGVESVCATLSCSFASPKFPQLIDESITRTQFHDVLPGTSIAAVHRDAEEAHARVLRDLSNLKEAAIVSMRCSPHGGGVAGGAFCDFAARSYR